MLFGLPKIDVNSIKEVLTSRSNGDALYMQQFNGEQITKYEVVKIKYVYNIVVHWRNPILRSRA